MLNLFHNTIKPILRQAAAWSPIPTPFQRKVYSTLQPASATGGSPFDLNSDPTL